MEHIYDVVIIGGGPAGYTAALYGARAGLSVALIEKMSAGGQMALTGDIENYPGFDGGIDGFTLGMNMQKGAERFGAQTLYGEVISLDVSDKVKRVITSVGEIYGKTLVIATGADPRKLGIEREEELVGRGVHYCAHCDGRFYKDKVVVVVGGGNSAVEDALYLAGVAKKVIIVHRRDEFRATKIYVDALASAENVEYQWKSAVVGFLAEGRVSGARLRDLESGEEREIACDGVFVSIGRDPSSKFLGDAVALDASGYIIADETTKTNVGGVFAAGDVRTKALRQIVTATSDGAVAIHFAQEYLNSIK